MKKLIFILLTLIFAQSYGQGNTIRISVDPVVLINETNFNIKLEFDSGAYGNSQHRIITTAEVLTGHQYASAFIGYGYNIPYKISNIDFIIQPSFDLGIILRWGWIDGIATSHSLNLRHQIALNRSLGVYIHNRLIHRTDLHSVDDTLPYYNIDNSIGIYYTFN